jgi:hypothetical protein
MRCDFCQVYLYQQICGFTIENSGFVMLPAKNPVLFGAHFAVALVFRVGFLLFNYFALKK